MQSSNRAVMTKGRSDYGTYRDNLSNYSLWTLKNSGGFIFQVSIRELKIVEISPFTFTHKPNKLAWSHLSDLVAQLPGALHWHHRGITFLAWLAFLRSKKNFQSYQRMTESKELLSQLNPVGQQRRTQVTGHRSDYMSLCYR